MKRYEYALSAEEIRTAENDARAQPFKRKGEIAFGKIFGIEWRDTSDSEGDLGQQGLKIRTVGRKGARLVVHPSDPDDFLYALMEPIRENVFRCVGYLMGVDAKRTELLRKPDPSMPAYYSVPQSALYPPSELDDSFET